MDDVLRACAVQMAHGDSLEANLDRARARVRTAAEAGAQLVLLPEYFFSPFTGGPDAIAPAAGAVRAMLQRASAEHGIALAANVVEPAMHGLANVGVVYEDGALAFEQEKVHPMPREAASGVRPGPALRVGRARGRPMGMLVCADILYPEAARVLQLQGAQVLLNPVMSPLREEDLTKGARDAVFVARAYDSGAFVLKAGGFRRAASPPQVAGRSLIAAPWGVLARYDDDLTEKLVIADLDFGLLRRFRESQAQFPPRQPHAYGDLL